ncbi:hypothetical protein GDO81_013798 [Engystomops pustulosus]|uniref:Uncharacterized protein n=1 Tax=Engystomops pustulosus TaxID=76066 RepID=A0AAV7B5N6_ENGPU|nr:hypothetical protein GDO81_013798 [Engystomops pustulosus]
MDGCTPMIRVPYGRNFSCSCFCPACLGSHRNFTRERGIFQSPKSAVVPSSMFNKFCLANNLCLPYGILFIGVHPSNLHVWSMGQPTLYIIFWGSPVGLKCSLHS